MQIGTVSVTMQDGGDGRKYFDLSEGESYCELGNSNSSSQHCSTCSAGGSHRYDDLKGAGVSQNMKIYVDGVLYHGTQIEDKRSESFGWWERRYRFRPMASDLFDGVDLAAVRRRIEDRLRKDDTSVKYVAILLGVKLSE